jgi:hypothetical protein
MQKKVLVTLISSAFAGVAGVAHAGPISVASVKTYATEAIGSATQIAIPPVAYSLSNPIALGSTITTTFSVNSGSVTTCPALAIVSSGGATLAGPFAGVEGGTAAPGECSYEYTVGVAVASNSTLSFTGGTVAGATALRTDGGSVVATVSVGPQGGGVTESNFGAIANSANAWSVSATASSSFATPEVSRVDVTAPTPLTRFTDGTVDATLNSQTTRIIVLGRVNTTANPGTQHLPDGATSYDFASATAENWSLTVTGSFATGSSVFISGTSTCSGTAATFTLNTGLTSGTATVDINGLTGALADDTTFNAYVCYQAGNTTTTVIPTAQFAVSGGFTPAVGAATSTTKDLASTNLYNLTLNGVRIDVRNYVPNAFAGWFSAYRIINTGAVAAGVRGQFIGQDGALIGTAQALTTAPIPAGGVVVLNSADIEGVLGAASAPGGVGPRLRLTAPTDSLRVQAFACQPSGPCFLNTDAMVADDGGAAK